MSARRKTKLFGLHVLRAVGFFRFAQWATRRRLRILGYHGFALGDEYRLDPFMFMRREVFERRLQTLKRRGLPVVSLAEAVRRLAANAIDNAETVITIDDGWKTTLTVAAPLLVKYALPACVYVTTEHLQENTDVFNVALSYLLWAGNERSFTLTGVRPQIDGTYACGPSGREACGRLRQNASRHLTLRQRQTLLATIAAALDQDIAEVLKGNRFGLLSADDMRQLTHMGCDIELHTHTHVLPAESFEAMRVEIEENRRQVTAAVGGQPRAHFCYPSGLYQAQHPEWLRRLGIQSATTCHGGHNPHGADPLRLGRYLDRDDASDIEFEAEVAGVMELIRMARNALKGQGAAPESQAVGLR